MQIVRIMGGLGNQLFSYAFALKLRSLGRDVALDTSWYEKNKVHNGWELGRLFSLEIPVCTAAQRDALGDVCGDFFSRARRRLLGPRNGHIRERVPGYDPYYLSISGDAYFDGFWQSPLYHAEIEAEIDSAFSIGSELEPEANSLMDDVRDRVTIGVHVRRGDYLESDDLGGVCSESYYRLAIARLSDGADNPIVLFFSDDLDWCRDRLGSLCDAVYIDWNRGRDSWRDMRLMAHCDRLAISNSSFSWWGDRLGPKGRMIVAPTRWFGGRHPDNPDIARPDWIRLGSGRRDDSE